MPFRLGSKVYEDSGFTVSRRLEQRADGSYAYAGFALVGADIDPSIRYDNVNDAVEVIDRLLRRSAPPA